ncbi:MULTISPECIES: transposase [unclassified Microbacterium]|uniref:transposase n=1 Tax=unclassified Microbacterium TaxID=2609290 RepID=UPI000EA9227C|nr:MULTISPECIES: transposase [unclassified Microbacterium]MBT2484578.1 transposase [Microbacterium sp. ISL-108]RKN67472.1 transposase [Microbacterium sp. CGR2]
MADPTFEEIAADLYAGAPDEFVSSRNARAKALTDTALAARVRGLRKPSVAAWVVNVFAQERREQLQQALQLAAELREAQEDLDAAALAKLGRERRVLTRHLAETAAELAAPRGERITPATIEAVEQSISAAFFDPGAAAAVSSGRLVRPLEPTSTSEDVRDAVVGDVPTLAPAPARPTDELKARRERREAERRVVEAEKDLATSERELAKQDKALSALQARAKELADDEADLEAQLAKVRAEAQRLAKDLPDVESQRAEAEERTDAATSAVRDARGALEAL